MNIRLVGNLLGKLLLLEAGLMFPSFIVSLACAGTDRMAFVATIALLACVGGALNLAARPRVHDLRAREAFIVVSTGWILLSAFGALPFRLSGAIPAYVDAFFETVSGFTTTGASILPQVETLPRGVLFWRSFTHWIGGMGVLVLTLAITPKVTGRTSHLMRAESPGPELSRLVPRMGETAKILYLIYVALTLANIVALLLAGLPAYDACIHAFGTAGTGGFSCRNLSVGAYDSVAVDVITTVFMLMFGLNFAFYFHVLTSGLRKAARNEEIIAYLCIVGAAILIVTLNILPVVEGGFFRSLRYASFQVASIVSTTGYFTADFNAWPQLSRAILVGLMLMGSCAGSTAGGVKTIRVLLLCKNVRRQVKNTFMPRRVSLVKLDGKTVEEATLSQVGLFFFAYVGLLLVAMIFVSADGFSLTTNFTAVLSAISNVGPCLGDEVGVLGNYGVYGAPSKLVLSFCMLAGRLEIFPMLVLLSPSAWGLHRAGKARVKARA